VTRTVQRWAVVDAQLQWCQWSCNKPAIQK